MPHTQDRHALRQHLRQARLSLSADEQRNASQRLATLLIARPELARAQVIALYLANNGEPNLMPLARLLWQQGKTLALPVMAQDDPNKMVFQRFTPETPMTNNRYAIAEPSWQPAERIPRKQMELMLLPLVGFDERGNRLGMGAGFYDRYLADDGPRPQLVGIAHECQRLDHIDSEPWDIPMDAVATPERWIETRTVGPKSCN